MQLIGMTTNTRFVLILGAATVLFLAACTDAVAQSSGIELPITIPTKFDTGTDHLLVRVLVNNAPAWCNIDTGFSALMAMDRKKAAAAGLAESSGIPTPDGNAPYARDGSAIANVSVGSLTWRDQPIIIRDLQVMTDMECIIGAGLLRQYLIEFDHSTPQVRLHDRTHYSPPAGAVAVPLIFRSNPNVPFIQVGLQLPDGTRQQFQTLVDTGTAYYALALVSPASTNLRRRLRVALRPVRPQTGSGPVELIAARAAAVMVGPFTMEEPVIALIESGLNGGNDDGTLGSGFLNRFTIGFDFVGRRIYLTPNPAFRSEQRFDASGLGFKRTDTGYVIDIVVPDSPAEREGLQVGDTLLTIDGTSAASLTPNELRDRLSRPGATCDVRLSRMGKRINVLLKLQRRL